MNIICPKCKAELSTNLNEKEVLGRNVSCPCCNHKWIYSINKLNVEVAEIPFSLENFAKYCLNISPEKFIWKSLEKKQKTDKTRWQQFNTPDEICNQMVNMYKEKFNPNDKILILFNLEFIKALALNYENLIYQNIYFITDCEEDFYWIKKHFNLINIAKLEKFDVDTLNQQIGIFNMKKFDIVFSNPPYSTKLNINIDIKILNLMNKISKKIIFIMPAMQYLSKVFNNNIHLNNDKKRFEKNLSFLTDFVLINNNIFNGNCCTDQNLCIVNFDFNKINNSINYFDTIKNVKYKMNSIDEINVFSSFDEYDRHYLKSIKTKIDNWLKTKDLFSNHKIGQCLDVYKKLSTNKIYLNNLKYCFWLPSSNGGGTNYIINDKKNKNFGIINSGTKKHYEDNINFNKDLETFKTLGKNRTVFLAKNQKEIDINWNFAIFSPIVKIIFAFYRSARAWSWNIVPWFNEIKTYDELCDEINFSNSEKKFIKEFLNEISIIKWD